MNDNERRNALQEQEAIRQRMVTRALLRIIAILSGVLALVGSPVQLH